MGEKVMDGQVRWMRRWGTIAWWIVVCYSVPFGIYTLAFVSGKFEIYKRLTVTAAFGGNINLAGLHIARNVRLWQIHAAAALVYLVIGPLQFNPAFRSKNPGVHKRLGYTFALCTVVTAVTGATVMRKDSELGPLALSIFPAMSTASLVALAIAINLARHKNFQTHRRWMLRSAAIGYSVMFTRFLPLVITRLGVSWLDAMDYSFPLSLALNSGLVEIYIHWYLTQADRKPDSPKLSSDNNTTKKVS